MQEYSMRDGALNSMPLEKKGFDEFAAAFIICAINVPRFIGLDFISEYNCETKMKQCSMVVYGRLINCELK